MVVGGSQNNDCWWFVNGIIDVGLFDDQWMKLWSEWSNGDRVMVRLMIED
jgi:hypothetical protein